MIELSSRVSIFTDKIGVLPNSIELGLTYNFCSELFGRTCIMKFMTSPGSFGTNGNDLKFIVRIKLLNFQLEFSSSTCINKLLGGNSIDDFVQIRADPPLIDLLFHQMDNLRDGQSYIRFNLWSELYSITYVTS